MNIDLTNGIKDREALKGKALQKAAKAAAANEKAKIALSKAEKMVLAEKCRYLITSNKWEEAIKVAKQSSFDALKVHLG